MIFELTVDEANVVLGSLAKMPYEISVSVIQKMQSQAQSQTGKIAEPEPAVDKKVK